MRLPLHPVLLLGALGLLAAKSGGETHVTVVACAPGYPGTTAEAQSSMDAFAAALAHASGWPPSALASVYEPSEQGGEERLSRPEALVALVPTPFLAKYGKSLGLVPRLQVEEKGTGLEGVWSLVAKKGRVSSPAALAGFTLSSVAGYAPSFVREALSSFGELPEHVRIVQSSQVLSSLRRAAAGEDVAVLLDAEEASALATLPFASDLEVVARSRPLPTAFVCTMGDRLTPAQWKVLERGFLLLAGEAGGAAALDAIRMVRFTPLAPAALAEVRRLEGGPPR
ncbi:MAG TPA: hypothetical protein VLV17_05815 [Anaeromyxobacteraceae bacterium]|nr:hypothetical protein [Anaeromyxobacteraceae bacterium]